MYEAIEKQWLMPRLDGMATLCGRGTCIGIPVIEKP